MRGRSSSPNRDKNFLYVAQTVSGAHPASYPMATGGFPPPGKADHSPPTTAEVKKTWFFYTSTPPYAFIAWFLIG
jgi:hypothetical protein